MERTTGGGVSILMMYSVQGGKWKDKKLEKFAGARSCWVLQGMKGKMGQGTRKTQWWNRGFILELLGKWVGPSYKPEKIWENELDFLIDWFQVCQFSLCLNMLKTWNFLRRSPALEHEETPFLKPCRMWTNQWGPRKMVPLAEATSLLNKIRPRLGLEQGY